MAKGKPTKGFLEALKQDKKNRGEEKPGGGFKTPEWFFKPQEGQAAPTPAAGAPVRNPNLPPLSAKKAFRFTWLHGAGAGIILLGVVLVAYKAGEQQQPPQFGTESEDVRQSPPQAGVLEPILRSVDGGPTPIAVVTPAPRTQGEVLVSSESGERIVGMNYVVIQSYLRDQTRANEAAAALKAGGLGCTVEAGLAGYASSSWFVVVGTTPFTKATTPEYQAYVKKVQQISEKFAGTSKENPFKPAPYKWR